MCARMKQNIFLMSLKLDVTSLAPSEGDVYLTISFF